jgi:hypothetical protein
MAALSPSKISSSNTEKDKERQRETKTEIQKERQKDRNIVTLKPLCSLSSKQSLQLSIPQRFHPQIHFPSGETPSVDPGQHLAG